MTPKPAENDVRSRIRERLNSVSDEALEEMLLNLPGGVKRWGWCPKCREKVCVDYPDYKGYARALSTWVDQAFGKPAEEKNVNVELSAQALPDYTPTTLQDVARLALELGYEVGVAGGEEEKAPVDGTLEGPTET